jgi:molybdenum cofactor cytidylyltransferase
MNKTGIIILAAGNASRFGKAKQLVQYNHKSLLQHVLDEAVSSGADPVIVVTGAYAEEITKNISRSSVRIVWNADWPSGMAGSIVTGLREAIREGQVDRVIITVSDQPFVSSSLFKKIIETQKETGKPIVASAYADTIGTPALFTKIYFDTLLNLQGEQGAKKILQSNVQQTAIVDFPEGQTDIDVPADFEFLLKKKK